MKIAIIVPEYNEGDRVVLTVKSILKESKCDVLIIDDGSTDGSFGLIKKSFENNNRVMARRHVINLGKGSAMKTGVELAWKLGFEAVIFVDADGQHNPKHLKDFEKGLEESPIVFGYRALNKKMPFC